MLKAGLQEMHSIESLRSDQDYITTMLRFLDADSTGTNGVTLVVNGCGGEWTLSDHVGNSNRQD